MLTCRVAPEVCIAMPWRMKESMSARKDVRVCLLTPCKLADVVQQATLGPQTDLDICLTVTACVAWPPQTHFTLQVPLCHVQQDGLTKKGLSASQQLHP